MEVVKLVGAVVVALVMILVAMRFDKAVIEEEEQRERERRKR